MTEHDIPTEFNPSAEFSLLTGDFTGDGKPDLMAFGHAPGSSTLALSVLSGSGQGNTESMVTLPPSYFDQMYRAG